MLRVFLVDDHDVVRSGVADMLDEDEELTVIGQAAIPCSRPIWPTGPGGRSRAPTACRWSRQGRRRTARVVSMRASHANQDLPPREFEQEPLLAALLTRDRGPHAEVRAGMALQRVLLTATAEGLATSFLSQPFETPHTRDALGRIFDGLGQPHSLLRIGYGYPTRMTSRRPVGDVQSHRSRPDVLAK